MRLPTVLIAALLAGPVHAEDVQGMLKDALRHELERRQLTVRRPDLVFDAPIARQVRYNEHWRLSGRLGPFLYRDDNIEDGYRGRFSFVPQGGSSAFKPENLSRFTLEIRKEF